MASAAGEIFGSMNCSVYPVFDRYTPVAILRGCIGTLSAVCCLLVIFLIVLFKKYKCFTQRLILSLTLAAFVHSLSYPLTRINYYTERQLFDPYCYFGGLFNHYATWTELLSLSCLTFNIFLNAVFDKWPTKIEYVYVSITYFLPLLWIWIPVINHTLANQQGWCDTRTINEDCTRHKFGSLYIFISWYIPLTVFSIIQFVAISLAICKIRHRSKGWSGLYQVERQQREMKLQQEVKPLLWYPILYLILNIFSLVNNIDAVIRPSNSILTFWYLHAVTSPLRGLFIVLVYSLDPETRKKLKWRHIRNAFYSFCHEDDSEEYGVLDESKGDSVCEGSEDNGAVAAGNYSSLN